MQIHVQGVNKQQRLNCDVACGPKSNEGRSEVVQSNMSKHARNQSFVRAEPGRQFSPVRTANSSNIRSLIKRPGATSRLVREKRHTPTMDELAI